MDIFKILALLVLHMFIYSLAWTPHFNIQEMPTADRHFHSPALIDHSQASDDWCSISKHEAQTVSIYIQAQSVLMCPTWGDSPASPRFGTADLDTWKPPPATNDNPGTIAKYNCL